MLGNTLAERSTAARRAAASRAPTTRSRVTNRPRKMVLSGTTTEGRRLLDIADALADGLGGWKALSDLMAARVRRAAELVVLAEMARRDALTGKVVVNPDTLVRLENTAARSLAALGLKEHERDKPASGLGSWTLK
jgi:hypothetical protein